MSEGSFGKFETDLWTTVLRQSFPSITANARSATKSSAPLGVALGKVKRDRRRDKLKGTAKAVSTATSSSGK